ncbi:MAG: CRTAC1 family protein [Flavobacteriales bacterium]|nr:CRTAC1 family protein [Flavobacteriales bacterium]MBP9079563.1 CRTAC1 family protein [Flavobacteriales bacterium]
MRTFMLLAALCTAVWDLSAQVLFQNVSTVAGLDYQGRSFGSSWGDINGDGHLDLFMSCHQNNVAEMFNPGDTIRIFLNLGNGQFDDGAYSLDDGNRSDFHGGVFFDRENDGDQDMLLLTGGTKKNVFLLNEGTTGLMDHAEALNIDLNKSRGRQSTLMDINNDGFTDVLVNNDMVNHPLGHGTVWMKYDADSGYIMATDVGQVGPHSWVSCISDLNLDGKSDLIVVNFDSLRLFSLAQTGVFQLQNRIDYTNISDISVADFNGDLLPDIFLTRSLPLATDIQQFNDSAIHASCNMELGEPPAVLSFKAACPVEVSLMTLSTENFNLNIGNDSTQEVLSILGPLSFTLDPGDTAVHGFPDIAGLPVGMNCSFGYQLPDSVWQINLTNTGPGERSFILQVLSHGAPVTEFTSTGTPTPGEESRNKLLLNQGNFQFTESTDPAFTLDQFSMNVTSGDFDNDMDIDLIVVETGRAMNRPNHLYENIGNDHFVVHENGWGTKGDVAGIGDAVTAVDFNNDGFLDLFVTNGSTSFFLDSAGIDLYENQGNSNHWLTLKLEGTACNMDGIGAQAFVLAGGVTQVAQMTGGIHASSQDDTRLHFGLGVNTVAAQVVVRWPNGAVDTLSNVPADQFLTIVEGEHPLVTGVDGPSRTQTVSNGIDLAEVDHVVIHDALGKRVGRVALYGRDVGTADLHVGPGLYLLSYMSRAGSLMGTRKFVQH